LKNVKPEESLRMYLSMPLQHRDIEQKVDDHFAAREQELAQITDRAERQVAIEQHPDRNRSVNLLTKLYGVEILFLVSVMRVVTTMTGATDIQNKSRILNDYKVPSSILFQPRESVPLVCEVETLLQDPNAPLQSGLMFGVHLLAATTKAYHWASRAHHDKECYLATLQFAMEVRKCLNTMLEFSQHVEDSDMKSGVDLDQLPNFSDLLKTYCGRTELAIYDQAPWTAGGIFAAMLGHAQYIGLVLLRRQGIFGSFLHAYNMLQHLKVIPQIEPLEGLCALFDKEIFMGTRPNERFESHLARFNGRSATVPTRQTSSPEDRFSLSETSVFINQSLLYTNLDHFTVKKLGHGLKLRSTESSSDTAKAAEIFDHFSRFEDLFTRLETVLMAEFKGDMPLATTNVFEVYQLCMKVWRDISAQVPDEFRISKPPETHTLDAASPGFEFHDCLRYHLAAAKTVDGRQEFAKRAIDWKTDSGLMMMGDAIVKVWGGKTAADMVWKEV
jgi:hypothetical protein